ncbi:MAG: mannose-1-phosphate guanylyltransferase/mannose-6-phosphate isomerase [Burkholderiales bacterium]
MKVQPVLLCGGAGTRLWPLSREQHPKQLLSIAGEHTLLQSTALRLDATAVPEGWQLERPLVVVNEDYRFTTAEQLRQAGVTAAAIILEPAGRNTAPALTIAALQAVEGGADPVLVVMPSDHVMTEPARFRETVAKAVALAAAGKLITFGITPTAAETGYGYIQAGERLPGFRAHAIARFVEKPDQATAQQYLASGEYLWNSGIFVMRASVWLAQMEQHRPDILQACREAAAAGVQDRDFLRVGAAAFAACAADSIDYAVMEKLGAGLGVVLPLAAGWSDVGAWGALWEIGAKDGDGNVLSGDVIAVGSRNTFVRAEGRLVACVGLNNVVVVETSDAVLVGHRDELHRMKEVVAQLKAAERPECIVHRKVYRPWGSYDGVDAGHRFQVKRIVVNPGASLSLQMHHHRAEHWIVVTGTARVTRGEEVFLLSENESTYIPIGTRHRLENPGKVPLELIEVQSGSYLGEDDIVRFEDTYGREQRPENVIPLTAPTAARK